MLEKKPVLAGLFWSVSCSLHECLNLFSEFFFFFPHLQRSCIFQSGIQRVLHSIHGIWCFCGETVSALFAHRVAGNTCKLLLLVYFVCITIISESFLCVITVLGADLCSRVSVVRWIVRTVMCFCFYRGGLFCWSPLEAAWPDVVQVLLCARAVSCYLILCLMSVVTAACVIVTGVSCRVLMLSDSWVWICRERKPWVTEIFER